MKILLPFNIVILSILLLLSFPAMAKPKSSGQKSRICRLIKRNLKKIKSKILMQKKIILKMKSAIKRAKKNKPRAKKVLLLKLKSMKKTLDLTSKKYIKNKKKYKKLGCHKKGHFK